MNQGNIRNFVIIAHIDHGKSTLADRFLELTKTVPEREMKEQVLDQMDLERERGITIKLQPVRMIWKPNHSQTLNSNSEILNKSQIQNSNVPNKSLEFSASNLRFASSKQEFVLNLIDTPGHVDFTYEVSRSLAAVEGAVLLVDATQGVQAQTLTNLHLAKEQNLIIIPVINKIDLSSAEVERVSQEIETVLGIKKEEILLASAKEGANIGEILDAVVERIPSPKGDPNAPLQALIFDSVFDPYRGVVAYIRVVNGSIKKGGKIRFLATDKEGEALEVGYFKPKLISADSLNCGEIGYIVTGLKSVQDAKVGDTITVQSLIRQPPDKVQSLPGYKQVKPFVFASFFTTSGEPKELREALEKLKLNDAALVFEPEKSSVLELGFRCGFLGLLHLDIVRERLEREYNLDLIVTTPSVPYQIVISDQGSEIRKIIINNPSELPDPSQIREIQEPYVKLELISPANYLGPVMDLAQNRRGVYIEMKYLDPKTVLLTYEIPLVEILVDFYDQLKQVSSGYASLNYELIGFRAEKLAKMDFLIAGDKIEPLSVIIPEKDAHKIGQTVVKKLKEVIPRQNFEVSLQAAVGAKILAREDIPAFRKDVTEKLYGGDYSRKRKLLEKQKAGKKRLKRLGKIDIPQEAFLAVLKR